MIIDTKVGKIQAEPGRFPTLISDDKREDGKLMGNRTKCVPRKLFSHGERFSKTEEEKFLLKKYKKESKPLKNVLLVKV